MSEINDKKIEWDEKFPLVFLLKFNYRHKIDYVIINHNSQNQM